MKARADLAALRGADRDVLQVRLGRGQPAGRGRGQRIGGVDAPGLGMDVAGQRVGVGRFQLGQLPPVDDLARQLVAFGGEVLQHLRGRSTTAPVLVLRAAGQAHLAEQDVAELLGRADVEALAGQLVDLVLERRGALRELARQPATGSGGRPRCRAAPCAPAPAPAAAPAARRRAIRPLGGEPRLQHAARAAASRRRPRRHRRWRARSATRSKVTLLLPEPATSLKAIGLWPSQRLAEPSMPWPAARRRRAHRRSASCRRTARSRCRGGAAPASRYLTFWPIFRTERSSSSGFSARAPRDRDLVLRAARRRAGRRRRARWPSGT